MGFVAADASLATLLSDNNAYAYVASGAAIHDANCVFVIATSNSPLTADAYGVQVGLVCAGASIATASEGGTAQAYVDNATIDPVGRLLVSSTATSVINAVSKAGLPGLAAGTINSAIDCNSRSNCYGLYRQQCQCLRYRDRQH